MAIPKMEGGSDEDEDALIRSEAPRVITSKCCGFTKTETLFAVVITLMSVGVNFAIDIPAALQDAMSSYYKLDQYQFSLFYTSYFLPSLFLGAFGGYLIDKSLGVRKSTILYSVVACIGISIFVMGGVFNKFWLMIFGRLLFGLGNEMATTVCMSYCTFTSFSGSSVNCIFSLSDNMSFLGTLAVFQLAPFTLQLLSVKHSSDESLIIVLIICSSTYIITAGLCVWITYIKTNAIQSQENELPEDDQHRQISFLDVLKFPPTFWLLCLTYFCFINANYTFEIFSQGLFTSELFKFTVEEASNAITIMNSMKIAIAIPLSLIVDRIGKNLVFTFISMVLCTTSYGLLLIRVHPYVIMSLLGIAYSFTGCSIWAMFAYPINKHLRGSCYGIVSSASGLSQSVSPSIVGDLIDRFGYDSSIYFYLANSLVGVCSIVTTWILDSKSEGVLMRSPRDLVRGSQAERNESQEFLNDRDWNVPFVDDIEQD